MNGIQAVPQLSFDERLVPPGIKQKSIACKYVDDLSVASAIKLKECLQKDHQITKPLTYHSRTEHVLPTENNPMIPQLQHITNFASENQMKINKEKTKVMLFSRSKSMDFQPVLYLEDKLLEVVEEIKLLGIIFSSDLKWKKNIRFMKKMLHQILDP